MPVAEEASVTRIELYFDLSRGDPRAVADGYPGRELLLTGPAGRVDRVFYDETPQAALDELDAIIRSIRIELS